MRKAELFKGKQVDHQYESLKQKVRERATLNQEEAEAFGPLTEDDFTLDAQTGGEGGHRRKDKHALQGESWGNTSPVQNIKIAS